MLEIREDQIEALRAAVRRGFPDSVLGALQGKGLDARRGVDRNGTDVVSATDARGFVTTLSFQPDGAPRRLTLPSGEHYEIGSDAAGRLATLEHSGGARVELEHHASGLVKTLRRPGIDEHRFDYDDAGQLSKLRYPDGTGEGFEHDAGGNLVAHVARGGARTVYERDRDGYLKVVRDPLGRETRYEYEADKLRAVVFPDGTREEYGFDPQALAAVVTRRDGSQVYQQLDHDDALREVIWPDGSYLEFDLSGEQLEGVYSQSSWVSFDHGPDGEVAKEKSADGVVQAKYDPEGRIVSLLTPHGDVIRYAWDPDGRLEGVVDWDGRTQRFKYADDGTLSDIRYGNGLVEKQRYGHHARLVHARVFGDNKRVLSEQRYGYDLCGRLAEIEDADPREGWQRKIFVDADGRVTNVVDGSGKLLERFEYDAKGNIIRDGDANVTVGPMDEIVRRVSPSGNDELAYDGIGNVTRLPRGDAGAVRDIHCAYNADGSLRETRIGDRVIRYEYDALGRRILKTDGTETWRYGYFGHQLLWEEHQAAPDQKPVWRDYLWAPDSMVPIAFRERDRTYWIQCDSRGAPVRVFAKDGTTVWRARYDAFGRADVDIATVRQPWRLAGHYFDDETGLHYQLCRYYSPWLKTYLARDPYWQKPGATNYSYARNCPYDHVDPFGGLAFLAIAAIAVGVGALVGAVVSGVTVAAQGGSWRQIGAAAASGAISGAATVVGAIVGGLVGGPVGVVVGGMIGNAAGTFVGALAEQAINGEPICLRCAANEAAMAVLIDIALLGLGKIPGVKRVVRAVGAYLFKKGKPLRRWASRQLRKLKPKKPVTAKWKGDPPTPKQQEDLDELYRRAPDAKDEIDAKAQTVADGIPGAKVAEAPLKSPENVLDKANREYGGDVSKVKDVARNTIVVPPGQEDAARQALLKQYPDLPPEKIGVVDPSKDPLGYSGMNAKLTTGNGPAETQINSPHMIYAKEKPADARRILGDETYDALASKPNMPEGGKGHAYYEQYRTSNDPVAKEAIGKESTAYYDSVRNAAGYPRP